MPEESSGDPRAEARQPNWAQCKDCQHLWVAFQLPLPIKEAVRVMQGLRCPKCGAGSKRIVLVDATRARVELPLG